MKRVLLIAGFAALAVGCEGQPPIPEEICAEIASCGGDVEDDCNANAVELQLEVERFECFAEYDEYLFCVGSAGCSWYYDCEEPRDELEFCIGSFPD